MFEYKCQDCESIVKVKEKPRKNRFSGLCKICSSKKSAIKKIAVDENNMKICKKCNISKPATEQYFLKNKKGFCYSYCRDCKNNYLKQRYTPSEKCNLSEEELKIRKIQRYQKDKVEKWAKLLVNSSRHNAKRYGYDFDIDEDYILELFAKQNGKCYWYGVDLVPSAITRSPDKPSIDRIDCQEGYMKGNVVLSCMAANIGRNSCNAEIFELFSKQLRIKNG